jgi:hypothetical protein
MSPNSSDAVGRMRKEKRKESEQIITVLSSIVSRMKAGERVTAQTPEEQACFHLLSDVDLVGNSVFASVSSKKTLRSQIWSVICARGAPTWFITITPPDGKNPISLYYADTKEYFHPLPLNANTRYSIVAKNPVGAARFFHLMVQLFTRHALQGSEEKGGLFGKTSAYFGTVEQQGRLTLHLHLLLWIEGAPPLEEIRQKLLSSDSQFQQELISYFESCHTGDLMTGSYSDVLQRRAQNEAPGYDPVQDLPRPVPPKCAASCVDGCSGPLCLACSNNKSWWQSFPAEVDSIVSRCNFHTCAPFSCGKDPRDSSSRCKARFPRPTHPDSTITDDGVVVLKKTESMMNTYNPVLSYLLRSNTDVTCLQSGTALKAVVMYATNYITKTPLKAAVMFDTMLDQLTKNKIPSDVDDDQQCDASRRVLTKTVNALTAKQEIGSPMAAAYLLGHPDHYTDHEFVNFPWKQFVAVTAHKMHSSVDTNDIPFSDYDSQRLFITKDGDSFVPYHVVMDYMYRPIELEHINPYDFILLYKKIPLPLSKKKGGILKGQLSHDRNSSAVPLPDPELSCTSSVLGKRKRRMTSKMQQLQASTTDSFDEHSPSKADRLLCFTPDHPLFKTHGISMLSSNAKRIPNFLKHPPSQSSSDAEYFYLSMLTIFMHWRDGSDICSSGSTLSETYHSHHFTDRQRQLIKNFNVRNECLRSADDFFVQRKQAPLSSDDIPAVLADYRVEELHADMDEDIVQNDQGDDDVSHLLLPTNTSLLEQQRAVHITNILHHTG